MELTNELQKLEKKVNTKPKEGGADPIEEGWKTFWRSILLALRNDFELEMYEISPSSNVTYPVTSIESKDRIKAMVNGKETSFNIAKLKDADKPVKYCVIYKMNRAEKYFSIRPKKS